MHVLITIMKDTIQYLPFLLYEIPPSRLSCDKSSKLVVMRRKTTPPPLSDAPVPDANVPCQRCLSCC